jgi:hypothetical protein
MSKPVPGRAEVAVEYPDKLYIGTFEHTAHYEAHFDETGVALALHHGGAEEERRTVRIHLHAALFAEILRELAATAAALPADDIGHRTELCNAAQALATALEPARSHAGVKRSR